jgi:hypothetical protein
LRNRPLPENETTLARPDTHGFFKARHRSGNPAGTGSAKSSIAPAFGPIGSGTVQARGGGLFIAKFARNGE